MSVFEKVTKTNKKQINHQVLTSEGDGRKNNSTSDQTWPRWFWSVFRNSFHFLLSTLTSSKQNTNQQLVSDSVTLIGLLSPDECILFFFSHFFSDMITLQQTSRCRIVGKFPFGCDHTSWFQCLAVSRFMQLNPIYFCSVLGSIHRGRERDWERLCGNSLL